MSCSLRCFGGYCVSIEICSLKIFLLAAREYFEFGSYLSGTGCTIAHTV